MILTVRDLALKSPVFLEAISYPLSKSNVGFDLKCSLGINIFVRLMKGVNTPSVHAVSMQLVSRCTELKPRCQIDAVLYVGMFG